MEFKILHKEFNYLSDASDEKQDSLFFESGESVAELNILFLIDGNIHSIEFTLIAYGEVKIWDKEINEYIDQSEIIFRIKNDEELCERIYRNKNVEIVLGNGLYITYQLDDKESVEIDSDCYEVEDLKEIINNDKKILEWYKYAIGG